MRKNSRYIDHEAANRCAVCNHKFGLVRHYAWQTALCSSKCRDRFNAREASDRIWLGAGESLLPCHADNLIESDTVLELPKS